MGLVRLLTTLMLGLWTSTLSRLNGAANLPADEGHPPMHEPTDDGHQACHALLITAWPKVTNDRGEPVSMLYNLATFCPPFTNQIKFYHVPFAASKGVTKI